MSGEFVRRMDNFSTHNRQDRFDALDGLFGNPKIIFGERDQIRQLPRRNGPLLAAFVGKPTAAYSVKPQCFFARQAIVFRIHGNATNGFSRAEPIQRNPWVVTRPRVASVPAPTGMARFSIFRTGGVRSAAFLP